MLGNVLYLRGGDMFMSEKLIKDSDYTVENGVLRIRDGVEEIPDGNFRYNSEIIGVTVVIISTSVKRIGDEAFAFCENLDAVVFELASQSLCTEIGSNAFFLCRRLKHITLPYKLKAIGNGAFSMTGLRFIEIPGTVEKVSFSAFRQTQLRGIIMNEGVKYIEGYAFALLPGLLQTIVIPSTVLSIVSGAIGYEWIPANYRHNDYDGVYYRDKELLEEAKGKPKRQVITRSQQIGETETYDPEEPQVTEADLSNSFVIIN